MKKKIILGAFVLILVTINLSKTFINKNIAYKVNPLLNIPFAFAGENDDPNYSYAKELVAKEVYGTVYKISGGLKFVYANLPLGAHIESTYSNQLVAWKKNCDFWLPAKCDQNKVGVFPINLN